MPRRAQKQHVRVKLGTTDKEEEPENENDWQVWKFDKASENQSLIGVAPAISVSTSSSSSSVVASCHVKAGTRNEVTRPYIRTMRPLGNAILSSVEFSSAFPSCLCAFNIVEWVLPDNRHPSMTMDPWWLCRPGLDCISGMLIWLRVVVSST